MCGSDACLCVSSARLAPLTTQQHPHPQHIVRDHMVRLVHGIKPCTVEAERKIERKPDTNWELDRKRMKRVNLTDSTRTHPACDKQSEPDHKTSRNKNTHTHTHTHTLSHIWWNETTNGALALSWRLISPERHYIFSASKTPATVISHPLAVMELQTVSLFPGIDEITEPWDGRRLQTHFLIGAAAPFPSSIFILSLWLKGLTSLFLHATHFPLFNKSHARTPNCCCAITAISKMPAICPLWSEAKFLACQSKYRYSNLACHEIFFPSSFRH